MSTEISIGQKLDAFRKDFDALRCEIAKVVVGQGPVVDGVLTAVVTGGHVLLEGVPGVGKTLLIETLAEVVKLTFQRVQFTPDLMPSDLMGTYVVMETPEGRRTFEFQKGPIFSHIVLADQINRAAPKTQSALLEAMEGQAISVSNETFDLPQPFFVLATQNPLEMEGTFPLPEPQIDRFLFKLTVAPPTSEQIEEILDRTTEGEPPGARKVVRKVVDGRRILEMREIARRVPIDAGLRRQGVAMVALTHPDNDRAPQSVRRHVRYGSSPRGAQALVLGAKVRAIVEGRGEVVEQDLRATAHAALRHRMILNFEGQAENVQTDRIVDEILGQVFGPKGAADRPVASL